MRAFDAPVNPRPCAVPASGRRGRQA